jgi:hypothetical protein
MNRLKLPLVSILFLSLGACYSAHQGEAESRGIGREGGSLTRASLRFEVPPDAVESMTDITAMQVFETVDVPGSSYFAGPRWSILPSELELHEAAQVEVAYQEPEIGEPSLVRLDGPADERWTVVSAAECGDGWCRASARRLGVFAVAALTADAAIETDETGSTRP